MDCMDYGRGNMNAGGLLLLAGTGTHGLSETVFLYSSIFAYQYLNNLTNNMILPSSSDKYRYTKHRNMADIQRKRTKRFDSTFLCRRSRCRTRC